MEIRDVVPGKRIQAKKISVSGSLNELNVFLLNNEVVRTQEVIIKGKPYVIVYYHVGNDVNNMINDSTIFNEQ